MVSRLDLDGTYSPMGLVAKILKAEPNLKIPVPIEQLAYELDINEIVELKTEGFEGGLITDEARSYGGILVRKGVSEQRQRFTIGHELGHFLIVHHKPQQKGEFLCNRDAMRQWDTKSVDRTAKMEAEANRFASLVLMPPPVLRKLIDGKSYSTLLTVLEIHQKFNVSKEAAARAYCEYNPETVAILICKNGRFLRSYKNQKFPWVALKAGDDIPKVSALHTYDGNGPSGSDDTKAEYWIDTQIGTKIPIMFEQVMPQKNGYAMILLKMLALPDNDDFDPDADLTAKQRYRRQQERWNR